MMNRLRDASDVGFITNNGRINDPDSILVGGLLLQKYLPDPVILADQTITFKSYSAPEYENYKSLLKSHVTDDDYFIDIPPKNPSFQDEGACMSQSSSEQLDSGSRNTFFSDYVEEVSLFLDSLKGIAVKFQQGRNPSVASLQAEITELSSLIQKYENSPSVDNVNKLRESHASLLQKYSKYFCHVFYKHSTENTFELQSRSGWTARASALFRLPTAR